MEAEIHCFQSGETFLKSDLKTYDFFLLDVNMEEADGIEVAQKLRSEGIEAPIVYISAYLEMAPRGYSVRAFRYLLKNDLNELFDFTLDEVLSDLQKKCEIFRVKTQDGIIKLKLSEIVYFESYKRYLVIHTGEKEYKQYGKISDVSSELGNKGFIRIHKSYLLNMLHIKCIRNRIAFMKNGLEFNCSKENYRDILKKYMLWRGEN